MAVRNFTILKLLALLIFTFELLAPVVLMSTEANSTRDDRVPHITTQGQLNLFASLICEEAGEEGREGKEDKALFDFTEVNFVAVFQCLIRLDNLNWPKNFYSRVHSGSTLLPFISVFRI
jgi:hypothetical protein